MSRGRSRSGQETTGIAVAREDGFDFTSREYRDLYARSDATAFQDPVWLDAFYRILVPHRGAAKAVITGRAIESGEPVFVLPLITRRISGIRMLETCDLGVGDYAAPVCARGLETDAVSGAQVRDLLPAHDILRIRPVRAEHVEAWHAFLGGRAVRQDFSAHAAALSGDHGAWRESALDGSFRRMLDRKEKRFFKQEGAEVRLLASEDEVRFAVGEMARLRAGRFEGDMIQAEPVRQFYAEVAAAGLGTFARTYEIALDGAPFGYAFGITRGGWFNYLLIGCDYDRHGRHSPGLILYDRMIADWMAAGGDRFDFTIGDEPFKAQFGTVPTAIFAIEASRGMRGRLGSAALAVRGLLRGK